MNELLEELAAPEHEQWTRWSKAVAQEVAPARYYRWRKFWVPYEQLPEDAKELDREWARRVIGVLERHGVLSGEGR